MCGDDPPFCIPSKSSCYIMYLSCRRKGWLFPQGWRLLKRHHWAGNLEWGWQVCITLLSIGLSSVMDWFIRWTQESRSGTHRNWRPYQQLSWQQFVQWLLEQEETKTSSSIWIVTYYNYFQQSEYFIIASSMLTLPYMPFLAMVKVLA